MCGRVKIKQGCTCIPVEVKDISHIEAGKGNFVYVYLANGNKYKVWKILGEWEADKEIIASGLFISAGRSFLLNWREVFSYDKTNGALMKNKNTVPLNAEGFEELEKRFFSDNASPDSPSKPK